MSTSSSSDKTLTDSTAAATGARPKSRSTVSSDDRIELDPDPSIEESAKILPSTSADAAPKRSVFSTSPMRLLRSVKKKFGISSGEVKPFNCKLFKSPIKTKLYDNKILKVSAVDAELDLESLDKEEIIPSFLCSQSCSDAMPECNKILVLYTKYQMGTAFSALVVNGIRCAQIWGRKDDFQGLLTVTDFIHFLIECHAASDNEISDKENVKIKQWLSDRVKSTIQVLPTDSLFHALKLLLQEKIHGLPVYTINGNSVPYVITRKMLLQHLYENLLEKIERINVRVPFMKSTIDDLKSYLGTWGDIPMVTVNTIMIDVLKKFCDDGVSALPVLDEENKLVNIFTKFDVLGLFKDQTYDNVNLTVGEALNKIVKVHKNVIVCTLEDSLEFVISSLVLGKCGVNQLVVVKVDDKQSVVGMVSVCDILKFLSYQYPDKDSIIFCFMGNQACYNAVDPRSMVISVHTDTRVETAYKSLLKSRVWCCPLWETEPTSLIGMLTMTDFIDIWHHYFPEKLGDIMPIENLTIKDWRQTKESKPFVTISPDQSIVRAIRLFQREKIHWLPVFDKEKGLVVGILTPKMLLEYLYRNLLENIGSSYLKHSTFMKRSIGNLRSQLGTWDNIVTVSLSTKVIDVLDLLHKTKVAAIPVLYNPKKLVVDIFSKRDMLALMNETYKNMDVTVEEALTVTEPKKDIVCVEKLSEAETGASSSAASSDHAADTDEKLSETETGANSSAVSSDHTADTSEKLSETETGASSSAASSDHTADTDEKLAETETGASSSGAADSKIDCSSNDIEHFINKQRHEDVCTCMLKESLGDVIEKFVKAKVHRVVVVDYKNSVIGIISLFDVLKFLVLKFDEDDDTSSDSVEDDSPQAATGGLEDSTVFQYSGAESSGSVQPSQSLEKKESDISSASVYVDPPQGATAGSEDSAVHKYSGAESSGNVQPSQSLEKQESDDISSDSVYVDPPQGATAGSEDSAVLQYSGVEYSENVQPSQSLEKQDSSDLS